MAIIRTGAGAYEHELAKWEQFPHDVIATDPNSGDRVRPGNPYTFRPYPKMLYKAHPSPISNGKTLCMESMPNPMLFADEKAYSRATLAVEAFNKSCTFTVKSEDEERQAKNNGWRETAKDAMAFCAERDAAFATAAAEVAYAAQGMTEKARRELADADASTHEHVVDVPATRKRARE